MFRYFDSIIEIKEYVIWQGAWNPKYPRRRFVDRTPFSVRPSGADFFSILDPLDFRSFFRPSFFRPRDLILDGPFLLDLGDPFLTLCILVDQHFGREL